MVIQKALEKARAEQIEQEKNSNYLEKCNKALKSLSDEQYAELEAIARSKSKHKSKATIRGTMRMMVLDYLDGEI